MDFHYTSRYEEKYILHSCDISNKLCIFVGEMEELVNIAHPFQTVEEFQLRAGDKQAGLIHRLAGKYPQLLKRCGMKRVLLAVSVAWALTDVAKAGDMEVFDHIDEALSPIGEYGCVKTPASGCVMVEGQPFYINEGEDCMLRFLWDGFTIFIDHEGIAMVQQIFFDIADLRQSKAYAVMGEEVGPPPKPLKCTMEPPAKTLEEEVNAPGMENVSEITKNSTMPSVKENLIEKEKGDEWENVENCLFADLVDEALFLNKRDAALGLKMLMEPLCRKEKGKARDIAIEQTERLEYGIQKMKE